MAIPLIPLAGAALQFIPAIGIYALAGLLLDREFGDSDSLPDVEPQVPPFTPPFTGGQCPVRYNVSVRFTNSVNGQSNTQFFITGLGLRSGLRFLPRADRPDLWRYEYDTGRLTDGVTVVEGSNVNGATGVRDFGNGVISSISYEILSLVPQSGSDNCGNLPNPNDPIPESVGGGSLAPLVDSPIEVSGGIPIPSFAALLAALKAIADGIGAIGEVLDGVRRIGDAINKIREILDEFLNGENEKDKKDRDKRKISVGAWRRMREDGGFETGKFTAQNIEYSPYQLQVEIEKFPPTVSRKLGIKSPSYAHLEPIGWIFLRSANGGYGDPIPLRFLRNSISLNEDTTGISFSFRENPLAKANCRVWYSSDPDTV